VRSCVQTTKRPLRIALVSYRSKAHVGGQGIYLRHLSRELAALERRFASAVGRDHFVSADHDHAKRAIERAQSAVQRRSKTDR